ncbi:Coiled-coil domain-containing protein 87 [Lemmus lemmus]
MEPQNQEPDLKPIYHRLLSPLSLFPRKEPPPELTKRSLQEVSTLQSIPLAKLKVGPLCRQVSKRLAGSGRAARVTPKDRLRLTQVILEELKCSWREPPTEPFLDYENNLKLQKRLESYVLICSEQLFIRYLHLLMTLPATRRVFTESATLTRLAANLARDCTVFLTSPDVYRSLLADFQTLLNLEQTQRGLTKLRAPVCPPGTFKLCPIPWPHSTGLDQVPCSSLNLNYLIQLSRPYDFPSEPEPDPVKELRSIPQLKGKKRLLWVPSMKKEKEVEMSPSQMVPLPSHSPPSREMPPFPNTSRIYSRLRRGQSMPCLRERWNLADELGLPPLSPHPLTPVILAPESKSLQFGDMVAEDLKQKTKSMATEWAHHSPLESGLPPLLGVLTRRLTAQQHIEDLQKMLKSLQEEEASGQWDLHAARITPLHPQPVTMTLKLHNQMVVQVATVQLSDRYFLDTFHVEGAGVLYNHLTGELDGKAIEEMDADRLVGNSTKEVYKELMSRVFTSHFSFDEGPQIEPSADKDWSTYLSSAFIYQDKHSPVINHNLVGFYSRRKSTQLLFLEKVPSLTLFQKHKSWDKRSNRGVWMNWWKHSVSAEDYLKYLTTQETDFLHVVFQMYEEEASVEMPVPAKESLEIQHPPPLLDDEEPEFVPGEWNWSSVIDNSGFGETHILSLQQRLERLWVMLEVPDQSRLDMVIKYSSNARLQQLPALIRAWEQVLKPIQTRELLLGRLEWFERQASDPNRFFQKPDLMLSRLLEEDRCRSHIQRKLNLMESSLISLLEKIELVFGEPVTFKGRHYLEKMKQDKVEMLYWLQQQRRVRNLIRAQKAFHQSSVFTRSSSRALIAPGNTHIAR